MQMQSLDPEAIRRDFPVLEREVHGKPLVYLDSAATSQKPRAMIDRMAEVYSHEHARVEEGHTLSQEATQAFEATRNRTAKLINAAESREVIFCRGATEALNILAQGYGDGPLKGGGEVLVTGAEHHSNIVPWLIACRRTGARLRVIPVDADGNLELSQLESMLTAHVKVVSVTHVSNVTGCIYPVKQITKMARSRDISVIVDGAQAVPHMPIDVRDIGCDFYTGSGHKMGGPSTVGFLYGRAEALDALPVSQGGATMSKSVSFESFEPKPLPQRFEAGEPAFAEVEAWGAALDYWTKLGLKQIAAYERELTAYAVDHMSQIPGVRILGRPAERICVLSFVVAGKDAQEVENALDQEGIAVRAGTLEAQPFLRALGVEKAVRASFMFYNTRRDADALVSAVQKIAG